MCAPRVTSGSESNEWFSSILSSAGHNPLVPFKAGQSRDKNISRSGFGGIRVRKVMCMHARPAKSSRMPMTPAKHPSRPEPKEFYRA